LNSELLVSTLSVAGLFRLCIGSSFFADWPLDDATGAVALVEPATGCGESEWTGLVFLSSVIATGHPDMSASTQVTITTSC